MIVAVRRYARNEQSKVPDDLALAFRCRRFETLPVGQGLFDNPDWLIRKLEIAETVYDANRAYKLHNGTDAEFSERYPGYLATVINSEKLEREWLTETSG